MSRPTANLRLFVGLYPPHETVQAMLKALGALDLPPHRPTPPEQVHLTLQFIGDVPVKDLEETIESVRRSAAGLPAFGLAIQQLITLPERGPARLIAAQTDAPSTLLELHRRLALRLARNVRDREEERFRPHLTLCRFRTPARGMRLEQPLALEPFTVERITLMRSTLGSTGATHHEVETCELKAVSETTTAED